MEGNGFSIAKISPHTNIISSGLWLLPNMQLLLSSPFGTFLLLISDFQLSLADLTFSRNQSSWKLFIFLLLWCHHFTSKHFMFGTLNLQTSAFQLSHADLTFFETWSLPKLWLSFLPWCHHFALAHFIYWLQLFNYPLLTSPSSKLGLHQNYDYFISKCFT